MQKKAANRITPSGFTILEMMVVVAIFTVSAIIVTEYIIQGYKANQFTLELSDAIEHARRGIDTMEKELREANYSDNGDYPIIEAESQSITFYSDLDSDKSVEKLRYYLDGTNLIKGVTQPSGSQPVQYLASDEATTTISQYVRNASDPVFYYYNGDYPADTTNNPLTTPALVNEVKLIRMFLNININPAKAPDDFNLEVFVQLRNVKNNL